MAQNYLLAKSYSTDADSVNSPGAVMVDDLSDKVIVIDHPAEIIRRPYGHSISFS